MARLPRSKKWARIVQEYSYGCSTCKHRSRITYLLPGEAPKTCPKCVLKVIKSKRFQKEFPNHWEIIFTQIKETL